MKKWILIIDVAKCHDCNNCFMACKDEFCGNDHLPYSLSQPHHGHRWMNIQRKERGKYPRVEVSYLSQPCMHCDEPSCMAAVEPGEVYKRSDGIVVIDPVKAKGRKQLVASCPYNAIWWNDEEEVPQKCTLCAHLLDEGWKEPRCVQACPTGAMSLQMVDEKEQKEMVTGEKLDVYQPQYNTQPRVYYKNLYRYTTCLVSGSAALSDVDECAEGAEITLTTINTGKELKTCTNNFGDFKLDCLPEETVRFQLQVEYPGYETLVTTIDVSNSMDLGTLLLKKS